MDKLPESSESNIGKFFGDPFAEKVAAEDPFFKFISRRWRDIVTTVLAAVAIFYLVNIYQDTQKAAYESAGDTFIRVQHEFESLQNLKATIAQSKAKKDSDKDTKIKEELEKQQKQFDDTKKRLDEMILALSNTREPYVRLAGLYRGLLAREAGDIVAFKSSFNPSAWEQVSDVNSSQRLVLELQALAYARSLIDDSNTTEEARSLLRKLSLSSNYVGITASISLAGIANTPDERADALKILNQVQEAHPEQSALLKDEINRLR